MVFLFVFNEKNRETSKKPSKKLDVFLEKNLLFGVGWGSKQHPSLGFL